MSSGGGQSPSADYLMTQLPANVARAQDVANMPFTPYTGPLAPPVPQAIGQAQGIAGAAGTYQPQQVTAPMANAPVSRAAGSGVYGLPTAAPMSTVAPSAGAALPPRPNVQGMDPDARRSALQQWRTDRRAARGPGGGDAGPAPGAAVPGGPAVSAMEGLQGLDQYMNPYLSQVADRTLSDLDRFRQMALNSNESQANMEGAWGNSRLGVENALTNEGFANQAASALANLYAGGFDTGAGLLMGDKSNLLQNQQFNAGLQQQTNLANQSAQLQTALANQQAGLTGSLANQSAGLTGAGLNLNAASTLGQLGGLEYGMQSDAVNQAYQEFLRQQNYPIQQQQVINQALGLVPYSWSPSQNALAGMLPGAAQGAGYGLMNWMLPT